MARVVPAQPRGELSRTAASLPGPLVAACLYAALIPLQPVLTLPDGSALRFAGSRSWRPSCSWLPSSAPTAASRRPGRLRSPSRCWRSSRRGRGRRSRPLRVCNRQDHRIFYLVGFCFASACDGARSGGRGPARARVGGALERGGGPGGFAPRGGNPDHLVEGTGLCSTCRRPQHLLQRARRGVLITAMDRQLSTTRGLVRSVIPPGRVSQRVAQGLLAPW